MAARRTLATIMLMLAVTLGLFAMHTLGHNAPGLGHSHEHGTAVLAMPTADADCHCLHAGHGSAPHLPMDPTNVCVAILFGLTLLVATWLMLGRPQRFEDLRRSAKRALAVMLRGPPRPMVGLRLADLAVWRI